MEFFCHNMFRIFNMDKYPIIIKKSKTYKYDSFRFICCHMDRVYNFIFEKRCKTDKFELFIIFAEISSIAFKEVKGLGIIEFRLI